VDITVNLNDEQVKQLRQLAESLSVEPSELARAAVNNLLGHPADDFRRAASHVLQKNKELYERLS